MFKGDDVTSGFDVYSRMLVCMLKYLVRAIMQVL